MPDPKFNFCIAALAAPMFAALSATCLCEGERGQATLSAAMSVILALATVAYIALR